jgi:hypothetical protein
MSAGTHDGSPDLRMEKGKKTQTFFITFGLDFLILN